MKRWQEKTPAATGQEKSMPKQVKFEHTKTETDPVRVLAHVPESDTSTRCRLDG
jgi:hypothetical protein